MALARIQARDGSTIVVAESDAVETFLSISWQDFSSSVEYAGAFKFQWGRSTLHVPARLATLIYDHISDARFSGEGHPDAAPFA